MTKAMNAHKRNPNKANMTMGQIIRDAKKTGYRHTGRTECPACYEEMQAAMQTVGYTGITPPWAIERMGLKFDKKDCPTTVACTCGYRGTMNTKPLDKKKRPSVKRPIKITNKCIGKQCTNDLPADRKAYCHTCRPKAVSKTYNM